ncbi:MAG: AAA family ATPase [Bryobacteraceae bacterium]|nr:AAA family ATPase [Bryobacteraceae bacterium]
MSLSLLVASSDEQFREGVRDNLPNQPNARILAEFPEVALNLYIRVLQELERHPDAALLVDLSASPEESMKVLEKVRQAVPDLYIIAADYSESGETVIAAVRAGASDYLLLPLRRTDFRDAITRLEKAPRKTVAGESKLGKLFTFLGAKGGVGTTCLAVNFASVLAQRKQQTVLLDLDAIANDVCMQLGATPQYTLMEVGENLSRMDQALFEGFVTRDPLGFFLVGPPDSLDQRGYFSDAMFREFSTFLVEKYDSIVIDAGRAISDDTVLGALQASSSIFLVITQEFAAIRNAQRYLAFLMRMGFNQDQIKVVVNHYTKKPGTHQAALEQIQQTLNQSVFYGIPGTPAMLASINKARPLVSDRQVVPEWDKTFRAFVDKATGAKKSAAPKTDSAAAGAVGHRETRV